MEKIPQAVPAQPRSADRKVGKPKGRKPAKHNSKHGSLAGEKQRPHSKESQATLIEAGSPPSGQPSPTNSRSYCELW